ncbi:MAG: chromosome segregation protein SMC [Methylotenera sp.]|nr:chromosome segregation protein SMC [Methylotenera sp.]
MRLTHLKLAGFKSFVDATTLHIHGQRVGVVGPNGCGKSNVMESVRWVLGESSAKEMRADAMDAVIFNGSGNRKPISRASVELVFDNSLGGASGEWSQYAEISVKRVIERDKGSTYYINNTVVRRRDVADLFLGTGLGGRAYAIIGQNTISRIVEAKPEEMRVFLEEAAGISKYKERRRETELRLRDTRENLTRVEDILRELDKQILRLQSQAVVAENYHQLQAHLSLTKGQVWLLKKRNASVQWQNAQHAVEKLVNALEAQMASLRHSESVLETARQQNLKATDAVNAAQADYYEANAVVSNLENQVKNTTDARERLQLQLQQLHTQVEKNASQYADIVATLHTTENELQDAHGDLISAEVVGVEAHQAVAEQLAAYQAALATFNASQTAWLNAEQHLRLEQANIGHITRTITEAHEQVKRLTQNLNALSMPAESALSEKSTQLSQLEVEIAHSETQISQAIEIERELQHALKLAREAAQTQQQHVHVLVAEIHSLQKMQQAMHSNSASQLNAWLDRAGLANSPRLWQTMRIEAGWETAFEAVLGNRLNAIVHHQALELSRPPAALSVAFRHIVEGQVQVHQANTHLPLMRLVAKLELSDQAILQDWLAGVYALSADVNVSEACQTLLDGECLVNQHGDIYTRHSVTYYAEQSALHGVLERQARLEALNAQQPAIQAAFEESSQKVAQLETQLQTLRKNQQLQQQQLKNSTQQAHQLNLHLQQLKQQQANTLQRKTMLEADIALTQTKQQALEAEKASKQGLVIENTAALTQMQVEKSAHEAHKQAAETLLNQARAHLQTVERAHQEKNFNIKLIQNKINELNTKQVFLLEEKTSLNVRCGEVENTLAATKMEALKANLEGALNTKQTREIALANARNVLSESQEALMQQERMRMQFEQQLHPLRDELEASRLAEQEARLHFEQCQAELLASPIDEVTLTNALDNLSESEAKVTSLERKKGKLEFEIAALGAVNLAAIEELETEKTRKTYLDSQCADLVEASQTLEDAIRKIDRETRSRLQATFDEANKHFNELFTTLFGGGQARLELLGDEILDTGMQVFAQPPGKKNSTIHLLSGGEKALTALALVFALFRLNPAPFCLMDEVDAPLDDSNTERFCTMVKKMSERTQFLYVSHNKITMEMAQQLIGVTMQESGVSRIVDVDMEAAVKMVESTT